MNSSHGQVLSFFRRSYVCTNEVLYTHSDKTIPLVGAYVNLTLSNSYEQVLSKVREISLVEKNT